LNPEWVWVDQKIMLREDKQVHACIVRPKKTYPESSKMPSKIVITANLVSLKDNSVKFSEKLQFDLMWGFKIAEKYDTIRLNRKHNSKTVQIQSGADLDIRDDDTRPDIPYNYFVRKEFDQDRNLVILNITIPSSDSRRFEKRLILENTLSQQKEVLYISYDPESTTSATTGFHFSTSDYIVLIILVLVVAALYYSLKGSSNPNPVVDKGPNVNPYSYSRQGSQNLFNAESANSPSTRFRYGVGGQQEQQPYYSGFGQRTGYAQPRPTS